MNLKKFLISFFLLAGILLSGISIAVEPHEVLDDPVLEERARELSKGLRCLVCQNQNIDESDASLAADLRVLVRERLVAGDSDNEVITYIVDRYGEYVLLNPVIGLHTIVLWVAMPVIFLSGLFIILRNSRKRKKTDAAAKLTKKEEAALASLKEDDN